MSRMVLQLEKLIEVCKATVLCSEEMNLDSDFLSFEINSLLFDSRRLNSANHTVFFAIRTANNDGHRYINELYEKGVRVFVCTTKPEKPLNKAVYLLVDDSLKALQRLATYARNSFSGNVIAIGGSNGKTIVKEWSRVLIAQDRKVCFSPRSYNSQIGVALSLWQLNSDFEAGIFEAGISEPNEMQTLNNMIRPDVGLFTNIGDAHGVNFSSIEEKINEKLQLFKGCKKLLCSQDNPTLFEKVSTFCKENNIELLSYQSEKIAKEFHLTFEDKASIENAVSAIMLSKQIGISEEKIKQRLPLLSALDMRLQIKQSAGGSILINDSYSLDITSLEVALDFLNTQDKKLQRCVILSDLQEKSEDTKATMEKINTLLKNKGISNLYGIGTDFVNNETIFEIEHHCFETMNDFLSKTALQN
jgi:alanine racemase